MQKRSKAAEQIVARANEIAMLLKGVYVADDPQHAEVREALIKERKELVARWKRNKANRERNQAMRDIGMVKTPYGWE